jgi:hypothetical protein
MKKTIILFIGILFFSAGSAFSQKLKSGDVKVLKGQTSISLQYDYSGMAVGKYKSEQEYITEKVAEMNKKKAGSGDEWAGKWTEDRSLRFQPMFEKNINEVLDKFGVKCGEKAGNAKYTLIIHTTFTEPGFNSGVGFRKNANVNLMVTLAETANPGTPIATIEMKKVESVNMMGYDYDTGTRIQSCYDRAGKELGSFLAKNSFKK